MAENIDDNVGRLLNTLETLNIKDNTIIIYMSDNGPLNLRYNAGLKGKKGSVDEGGVKVPFIINWKDSILANKTINKPLAHIDVLPTLLDLVGADYNFKKTIDGKSFKELLKLDTVETPSNRNLFAEWQGNKRVRSGDFLMINDELFDLKNHPGQAINIRESNQFIYDSLLNTYKKWHKTLPLQKESKPIPVGYKNYPVTHLPAHEANLFPPFEFRKDRKHTGIAYHSLYGWAHDWIDFWTKPSAYANWDIDIVEAGDYEIALKYALAKEDVGVRLVLEIDNQNIPIENLEAFEHAEFENFDRVQRGQEAPETDWKTVTIGKLYLTEGIKEVTIKTQEIKGKKSIELKGILIKKFK